VARTSNLLRFGAPLLIGVLVLVLVIARVGAGDSNGTDDNGADTGDEYQVQAVEIESVDVRIAESFPVQIFVDVAGYVPDPCWKPQEPVVEQDGPRFEVEIVAERKADEMCPQVIESYEHTVSLGSMDPGDYVVSVNGVEQQFEVH
jgi:hypothetical protein